MKKIILILFVFVAIFGNATRAQNCTFTSPFSEDFNEDTTLPYCWTRYEGVAASVMAGAPLTATSSGWEFSNTLVFGEHHATLNMYGTSCHHWLVSPAISLNGISVPYLSFDVAVTSHNDAGLVSNFYGQQDDKIKVFFSTDDGATWTDSDWGYSSGGFLWISNTGQTVFLSLSAYTSQTIRIAFYGESSVSNGNNDLHIDNVFVGETSSCLPPSLFHASNITTSSANLSWTENGTATSWTLEYGPTPLIPGTGTISIISSTPTFSLNNLQDNTTYTVLLTSNCNDSSHSYILQGSFTTLLAPVALPYSTDFSDSSDRNWLIFNRNCTNRWTIGDLNSSSSALYITNDPVTQPAQYSVNSPSVVSAMKKLSIGTTRDFVISFDITVGGEGINDFVKLFFAPSNFEYPAVATIDNVEYATADYNDHACDFSPYLGLTSEQSYPYKFNRTNGNTVHVDVLKYNPYWNLATNSSVANLVFLWRNNNYGGVQPGAIISNLTVTPYPCTHPDGLGVNNITPNSAVISCVDIGTQNAWIIEYKKGNDTVWTVIPVTNTMSTTLTGLSPSTSYDVRIRCDCGNGEISVPFPYYDPWTFTTSAPPTPPTLSTNSADGITQTQATLLASISNPDHVPIQSYGFELTDVASGNQTLLTAVDYIFNSYYLLEVTGLTPATEYDFRAFIILSDGTYIYGNERNFTTLTATVSETCESPTDLQLVSDSVKGGVNVSWTDHAGASQWYLQYRPLGGVWITLAVTGSPSCSISGLEDGTVYEIHVQAVCDGGVVSEWSANLTVTTSSIDTWLGNSVNLYPNPAKEYVDIRVDGDVNVTMIEVYDVYGKLVNTMNIINNPTRININSLADGMYFVRVTTDAGAITKQFVKK